jgi:copper chaperone
METTTLQVTGMTCGHCEKAVKTALLNVVGVTEVSVSLKMARLKLDMIQAKPQLGN